MTRITLINSLLDFMQGESYLEIGVRDGKTIAEIKAKHKVGVDPAYNLKRDLAFKEVFGFNDFKLFKQTSDDFFKINAKKVFPKGIDLVFIDGLHNYEQSLRDVINCLEFLNPKGFLVLHDCNPIGAAQAFPIKNSYNEVIETLKYGGIEGWTGEWNGDVWKTIVHLRAFHPELNVRTIDADQGLGIVWFGKNDEQLKVERIELENAGFDFLAKNRAEFLGLISEEDFFEEISA